MFSFFSNLVSLKPLVSFYNIFKKKQLKHNEHLYNSFRINKKYFSSISSRDFKHLPQPKTWLDAKNSKDLLPLNPVFLSFEKKIQDALLHWSENGYALLEGFFSETEVAIVNNEIDALLKNNTLKLAKENKVFFALKKSNVVKKIASNKKLTSILELLLGSSIVPFQSLNFVGLGSEQHTHSDSVYMTTHPLGNLIAVWIALEDITLENGPIHYYPKSHKLPYILSEDYLKNPGGLRIESNANQNFEQKIQEELEKSNLNKKVFTAKKGDLFIWHANLLHGGEPHIDTSKTRKSLVLHYFSTTAICYHEISERPALILSYDRN